jgi:hypothetical protein
VPLIFNLNETSGITYSLDNHANITINGNTTLAGLTDGSHKIVIYATGAAGNTSKSQTFTFTINNPPPVSFDNLLNSAFLTPIAIVIVVVAAASVSLVAFKRHKKNNLKDIKDRFNKKIAAISFLIIATLFVGIFVATIFSNNSKSSSQTTEIAVLNGQVPKQTSNFDSALANLRSARLETALGATEVPGNSSLNTPTPQLYNHLYISGSVANNGEGNALNAGLNVVALSSDGSVMFNLTVPVDEGLPQVFGTDNATRIYGNSPLLFRSMFSGESVLVKIAIYHEGVVSNWVIKPVWTNPP